MLMVLLQCGSSIAAVLTVLLVVPPAFFRSSTFPAAKTYIGIEDTLPTVIANISAAASKQPLRDHKKGGMGGITGPMMIALGHDVPTGIGIGPDCGSGSCCNCCCWVLCCCQPPSGSRIGKAKSDFNLSITPKLGMGMHR